MTDWINTLPNIKEKVKFQLASKSIDTVLKLQQTLAQFTESGFLDDYQFGKFLAKIGLFLKTQELRKVYEHFDLNKDGLIATSEFIAVLKSELSAQRQGLIKDLWAALSEGKAALPIEALLSRFRPSEHPNVKSRRITADALLTEVRESFLRKAGSSLEVTEAIFFDYCCELNAVCPRSHDQQFRNVLKHCWNFLYKENTLRLRVEEIEAIIYEKVRQKTKTLSNEATTSNLAFFHFDLDYLKRADFNCFVKALDRFGCVFGEEEMKALFCKYDLDQSGFLEYEQLGAFYRRMGNGQNKDLRSVEFELFPRTLKTNQFPK